VGLPWGRIRPIPASEGLKSRISPTSAYASQKPNRLREREAREFRSSPSWAAPFPQGPPEKKPGDPPLYGASPACPSCRLQERCTHPAGPSPTREPLAGVSGVGRPDGAPVVEPAATDRPDLNYCAADALEPRTRSDRVLGRRLHGAPLRTGRTKRALRAITPGATQDGAHNDVRRWPNAAPP